jgi:hypothetical protein
MEIRHLISDMLSEKINTKNRDIMYIYNVINLLKRL